MESNRSGFKFAAALAALSMCAGSAANAATATARTVDPLVSLSVFGTAASRAAVCAAGAQAAVAAGSAVVTQAAPAQPGCVLPVVDAPPPVVSEAPPPAYYPEPVVRGGGIGVLPLLLGLAALIGAVALLLHDDEDGEGILRPISPV